MNKRESPRVRACVSRTSLRGNRDSGELKYNCRALSDVHSGFSRAASKDTHSESAVVSLFPPTRNVILQLSRVMNCWLRLCGAGYPSLACAVLFTPHARWRCTSCSDDPGLRWWCAYLGGMLYEFFLRAHSLDSFASAWLETVIHRAVFFLICLEFNQIVSVKEIAVMDYEFRVNKEQAWNRR